MLLARLEVIGLLEERNVGFQRLQESIDATTSSDKLIFHIFGALAELSMPALEESSHHISGFIFFEIIYIKLYILVLYILVAVTINFREVGNEQYPWC